MTKTNVKQDNGAFTESAFLKAGDVFTALKVKTFTTKNFNRVGVKILDVTGKEYFTTAAKIVRILTELSTVENVKFTVVQQGVYNEHPILTLKTEDENLNKEIMLLLF